MDEIKQTLDQIVTIGIATIELIKDVHLINEPPSCNRISITLNNGIVLLSQPTKTTRANFVEDIHLQLKIDFPFIDIAVSKISYPYKP